MKQRHELLASFRVLWTFAVLGTVSLAVSENLMSLSSDHHSDHGSDHHVSPLHAPYSSSNSLLEDMDFPKSIDHQGPSSYESHLRSDSLLGDLDLDFETRAIDEHFMNAFALGDNTDVVMRSLFESELPTGFSGCSNYPNETRGQQEEYMRYPPFCPGTLQLTGGLERDVVISSDFAENLVVDVWYRQIEGFREPEFSASIDDMDHSVVISSVQVIEYKTVFYNITVDITMARKPSVFTVQLREARSGQQFAIQVFVAGFTLIGTDLGVMDSDGTVEFSYEDAVEQPVVTVDVLFQGDTSSMRRLGIPPLTNTFTINIDFSPNLYRRTFNYVQGQCDPYTSAIYDPGSDTAFFENSTVCGIGFTFDLQHFAVELNPYRVGFIRVLLLYNGAFIVNNERQTPYRGEIDIRATGIPPPVYTSIVPILNASTSGARDQHNDIDSRFSPEGNQYLVVSGFNFPLSYPIEMRVFNPYRVFEFVRIKKSGYYFEEAIFRTVPYPNSGGLVEKWDINANISLSNDVIAFVTFIPKYEPFRLVFDASPVAGEDQTIILVHIVYLNTTTDEIMNATDIATTLLAATAEVPQNQTTLVEITEQSTTARLQREQWVFRQDAGQDQDNKKNYIATYEVIIPKGTEVVVEQNIQRIIDSGEFDAAVGIKTGGVTFTVEKNTYPEEVQKGQDAGNALVVVVTSTLVALIGATASQGAVATVLTLGSSTLGIINMSIISTGVLSATATSTAAASAASAASVASAATSAAAIGTVAASTASAAGASAAASAAAASATSAVGAGAGAGAGVGAGAGGGAGVGASGGAEVGLSSSTGSIGSSGSTGVAQTSQVGVNNNFTILHEVQFSSALAWTGNVTSPFLESGAALSPFNLLVQSPFSSGSSEGSRFVLLTRRLLGVDNLYDIYQQDIETIFVGQLFYISVVAAALIMIHLSLYLTLKRNTKAFLISMNVLPKLEVLFLNVIHMGVFIGGFRILRSTQEVGLQILAVVVVIFIGIGFPVAIIVLLQVKVAPYMNKQWLKNYFWRYIVCGGWNCFETFDTEELSKIENSWKKEKNQESRFFFVEQRHRRHQGIWYAKSSTRMRYGDLFEPYRGQYYGFAVFEMTIIALEGVTVGVLFDFPEVQAGLLLALSGVDFLALIWLWPYNDYLEQFVQMIISAVNTSIAALLVASVRFPEDDPQVVALSSAMLYMNISAVALGAVFSMFVVGELLWFNRKAIKQKLRNCCSRKGSSSSSSSSNSSEESGLSSFFSDSDDEPKQIYDIDRVRAPEEDYLQEFYYGSQENAIFKSMTLPSTVSPDMNLKSDPTVPSSLNMGSDSDFTW